LINPNSSNGNFLEKLNNVSTDFWLNAIDYSLATFEGSQIGAGTGFKGKITAFNLSLQAQFHELFVERVTSAGIISDYDQAYKVSISHPKVFEVAYDFDDSTFSYTSRNVTYSLEIRDLLQGIQTLNYNTIRDSIQVSYEVGSLRGQEANVGFNFEDYLTFGIGAASYTPQGQAFNAELNLNILDAIRLDRFFRRRDR